MKPLLSLPQYEPTIRLENEKEYILDPIRKKYLLLTPEEWVRQHFINLLTNYLNYPKGLFQVESTHQYFKSDKRSDILVLGIDGKPVLLVECKSPEISIGENALNQISVYNKTLKAQYISVTNGLKHFVWRFDGKGYHQLKEFPVYSG